MNKETKNIKKLIIDQSLELDCGKTIKDFPLAYETYGTLNKSKNNAVLFLTGRNKKKLEKLKSQILRLYKVKISIYVFDISNYDEIKNAFKNIFLKTKNIDVLINNAGILKDNFIGMISNRDINNLINTNLIGPINFTQLVSKIIVKKNSSKFNSDKLFFSSKLKK